MLLKSLRFLRLALWCICMPISVLEVVDAGVRIYRKADMLEKIELAERESRKDEGRALGVLLVVSFGKRRLQ